jgi:hypothetical protein
MGVYVMKKDRPPEKEQDLIECLVLGQTYL